MGQNILKTLKKMGTVSCMYNIYKNTPVSINHESKAIGIHIYLLHNYPLMVPSVRSTDQLEITSSRRIGNKPSQINGVVFAALYWFVCEVSIIVFHFLCQSEIRAVYGTHIAC